MSDLSDPTPEIPDANAFKTEEADINEDLQLRDAFSTALAQNGFPDTLVLARDRAEVVFHDRRLEILDYLKENEPASVRALAGALGYDKGVVSRDLAKLAKLDIIEYKDSGRAKAPRLKHKHVAIEPVV